MQGGLIANRAYSGDSTFNWIPLEDGSYTLNIDVRDLTIGDVGSAQIGVSVVANTAAAQPTVVATSHPLVAVYSTTCDSGQARVFYYPVGGAFEDASKTPAKDCVAGKRVPFIIAGLLPNTTYAFVNQVVSGSNSTMGSVTTWTTGTLPAGLEIPQLDIQSPQNASSSTSEKLILDGFLGTNQNPVAYDNQGNVMWYYYDPYDTQPLLMRTLPGGNVLLGSNGTNLREIDLAGNTVHEITFDDASQQFAAMGLPPVLLFNHDAVRLPNGYTAALVSIVQRADQGSGLETVLTDAVAVLDRNWKIVWAWNPFEKLDVKKKATLDDKVCVGIESCLPSLVPANDWTHANSLQYLPDGNFLVSLRNLDWIIKIDYRNGLGTGDVLWRLGHDGDFTVDARDRYPWFTHQHSATLLNGELTVFDNGNTRVSQNPGNSRGQVWRIDENSRIAHLILNVDVGTYSPAFGSAQRLANGNYEFFSGWVNKATEVQPTKPPNGIINFKFRAPGLGYRVFRMIDLYTPENVQ